MQVQLVSFLVVNGLLRLRYRVFVYL